MSLVVCSECQQESPSQVAREMVICWTLSASGRGTLTSPKFVERTGIFKCPACVRAREYGPAETLWGAP